MAVRMLQRRGTTAQWTAANPVLGDGELGIERDPDKDTYIMKVGDGVTAWADLEMVFADDPIVTSVFGRTGDVTATSEDLADQTAVGLALFTAPDGHAVIEAIGGSDLGETLFTVADGPSARTAIGAGTGNGNVVGTGITKIVALTQAAYTAISTPDPTTLYVIVG